MEESILKEILLATDGWNAVLKALYLTVILSLGIIYKVVLSKESTRADIATWIRNKVYRVNSKNLKSSPLFRNKSRFLNDVLNISFENNPLKTIVFQTFFRVKIMVDFDKAHTLLATDVKKMDDDEVATLMTDLMISMRDTFDNEIKTALQEMCQEELTKITSIAFAASVSKQCSTELFDHVMYSVGGYNSYRKERLDMVLDEIDLIRQSIYHQNNYERLYHFFDILYLTVKRAILRASTTFANFNGEIDNIFYKYHNAFLEQQKD
jgi:hypothetical protein